MYLYLMYLYLSSLCSSTNEYSIENTLQAQKWIYQHQHPINCTNRNFDIIQNFAWIGFGATIHQIIWAFGMAIAHNRIAVYQTPGYWVRLIYIIQINLNISLSFFSTLLSLGSSEM
jgi:hypothetical protein